MSIATNYCGAVFRHLAREFQRLNDLYLSLVASGAFIHVVTRTMIRNWTMHKYVEATLEPNEPLFAGWWVEIDENGGALRVYAYTSVDNRNYLKELTTRTAMTIEQFEGDLHTAVTALIETYSEGAEFRQYLDALRDSLSGELHSGHGLAAADIEPLQTAHDDMDARVAAFTHLGQQLERLNDFNVLLMKSGAFADVRWESYIRQLREGWKVESYVEARLPPIKYVRAIWSIEVYERDDHLQIAAVVKLDGADYFRELQPRTAVTAADFGKQLEAAVTELIATYDVGSEFRRCIDSAR